MPDYSQGKIYQIVNSANDTIYIGSTCQQLSARMGEHRSRARNGKSQFIYCAMREHGIEKFRIVLIEDFPCSNVAQLVAREYKHMCDAKISNVHLYNHMIDGHHSIDTRQKLSQAHMGKLVSPQTREKMRQARTGKYGEQSNSFRRGCIALNSSSNYWLFSWLQNGQQKTKYFSVKKFGDSAAHAFALIYQDEVYPKVDDDKELVEEIRARIHGQ